MMSAIDWFELSATIHAANKDMCMSGRLLIIPITAYRTLSKQLTLMIIKKLLATKTSMCEKYYRSVHGLSPSILK